MKNAILKTVTLIAAVVFLFCACCLDSESIAPFAVGALVSLAWLMLFGYANSRG